MRTSVGLAAVAIALGLGSAARGDIPVPPKSSATFTIEVDENAKQNRLFVPPEVVIPQRGGGGRRVPGGLGAPPTGAPAKPTAALESEDGDAVAVEEETPQPRLLVAGVALALSASLGGLWVLRRNGGSMRTLGVVGALGGTLVAAGIVWANAAAPRRPANERPPQAGLPVLLSGETKVDVVPGKGVRIVLTKDAAAKLAAQLKGGN
jgi:hypothetical protein